MKVSSQNTIRKITMISSVKAFSFCQLNRELDERKLKWESKTFFTVCLWEWFCGDLLGKSLSKSTLRSIGNRLIIPHTILRKSMMVKFSIKSQNTAWLTGWLSYYWTQWRNVKIFVNLMGIDFIFKTGHYPRPERKLLSTNLFRQG